MEDPHLGSLAVTGNLEESASHHINMNIHILGALPLGEGGGAKHSPPGQTIHVLIISKIIISRHF